MKRVHEESGYVLDPHTAVGFLAAERFAEHPEIPRIVLGTAHPAKFGEIVERATGVKVALPEALVNALGRKKLARPLRPTLEELRAVLEESS